MSSTLTSDIPQQLHSHHPPNEIFINIEDKSEPSDCFVDEAISDSCEMETPRSAKTVAQDCPTDERRASRMLQTELQSPRASTKKFTFDDYDSAASADTTLDTETRDLETRLERRPELRETPLVEHEVVVVEVPLAAMARVSATIPAPATAAAPRSSKKKFQVGQLVKRNPETQSLEDYTTVPSLSWYCCVIETLGANVEQLACIIPRSTEATYSSSDYFEAITVDNKTEPVEEEAEDEEEEEEGPYVDNYDDDEDEAVYAYGPNNTRLELELDMDTDMLIGALPTVPEEGESYLSDHEDMTFVASPKSESVLATIASEDEASDKTLDVVIVAKKYKEDMHGIAIAEEEVQDTMTPAQAARGNGKMQENTPTFLASTDEIMGCRSLQDQGPIDGEKEHDLADVSAEPVHVMSPELNPEIKPHEPAESATPSDELFEQKEQAVEQAHTLYPEPEIKDAEIKKQKSLDETFEQEATTEQVRMLDSEPGTWHEATESVGPMDEISEMNRLEAPISATIDAALDQEPGPKSTELVGPMDEVLEQVDGIEEQERQQESASEASSANLNHEQVKSVRVVHVEMPAENIPFQAKVAALSWHDEYDLESAPSDELQSREMGTASSKWSALD